MEDSMSSLSGSDSWMTEPMVHGTLERVFWPLFFSLTRDGDSGKSVRRLNHSARSSPSIGA